MYMSHMYIEFNPLIMLMKCHELINPLWASRYPVIVCLGCRYLFALWVCLVV